MSHERNEPQKKSDTKPRGEASDPVVNERVQELTWALLDEEIQDDELRLLDNLLLSDDAARNTYIRCVQLHSDLSNHYRQPEAAVPRTGKSLVLGFLSDSLPTAGLQFPPSEDVRS